MSIRSRLMRPKDIRECVDIIARHPILGPRYAGAISDVRLAWLRLLGSEAFRAVVFEEVTGSRVRTVGAGARAFVSDRFVREVKTPPYFWVGPEMARRVVRGDSPLLSDKEVREANSSGGLNLLVWEGSMRPEDDNRPEVQNEVMTAFMKHHRGFLLKEWMVQAATPDVLRVVINAGGFFLNRADGRYADASEKDRRKLFSEPHVVGLTREMALGGFGAWSSLLFIYEPPRFAFRRSEQRLLLCALDGGTDKELAVALGVSLSAVKKTWSAIYDRVAIGVPELIPRSIPEVETGVERGKEKKQRLITYLREHREELRPVSRRFFRQPSKGRPRASVDPAPKALA